MKKLVAFVLAVILVATPTMSHAYVGGELGLLIVAGVGYLLYLSIAEVVKAVQSSGCTTPE